jgi:hypothetical protein
MQMHEPRRDRRDKFAQRQAEEARRFELREKVVMAITDAVAPLAIDAREAQSTVQI